MNVETIIEKINSDIADKVQEISLTAPRRIQIKVAREHLKAVLTYLKEQFGFTHLAPSAASTWAKISKWSTTCPATSPRSMSAS